MLNRVRRFFSGRTWRRRPIEPTPLRAATTDPNELGLTGIHPPQRCADQSACPMHKPSPHHMRDWAVIWRGRILERLCPIHGTGHPDPDQFEYWSATGQDAQAVHGCCGCCRLDSALTEENRNA